MKRTKFEHKKSYIKHRQRVMHAKAIIDNRPPLLHVGNFARFTKLKEDVFTSKTINKNNIKLLIALNKLVRTKGEIDTFRTTENSLTPNYNKMSQKYRKLDELDFQNMRMGRKIICVKAKLNTRLSEKFKRKVNKNKPTKFQYPGLILEKYSNIEIPKNPVILKKFLRPKIWFNLAVKDVRPLGRIVMELHTEAAPQVVMEFVRLCFDKQIERLNFVRLFPNLWLQGELTLNDKTLIDKNIEYDKRSVNHGQYTGVLSFDISNFKKCRGSSLPFTISFKPLRVCNGSRVGFGRVCNGLKILNCIQDFGTKNGKPTREVIVTNCGFFA